ncbi:hypothetical protein ACFU6R_26515 [Streptomyces sp. NPDC057499]|uniref:hypothetical protein n=1 Tax=Streptomyces sp. NPDC057499 TaxID=3346150 RepID=UPI0036973C08
MRPEHRAARNHIEVWRDGVLPPGPERIRFRMVLRGLLPPFLVRTGVASFVYFVHDPVAVPALGGPFARSSVVGFASRRRAGYSVRCGACGVPGGVLEKSMAGF